MPRTRSKPIAGPITWRFPEWPAPSRVRALTTWRVGGVSEPPFQGLNLGAHVGDVPAAVAENRRLLLAAAGLPAEPVWLTQVHGITVRDLDAVAVTSTSAVAAGADAAITRQTGNICTILTADCLPVLLASAAGDRVGAAHAGWRGLAAGVIEATVAALADMPGDSTPAELMAWLGPAIGPQHFEVGAEVREDLLRADADAHTAFELNGRGRYTADLYALARRRLRAAGVTRIFGGGDCTFAHAEQYFSHRREGRTGRQATLIWLEPAARC